MRNKTLSKNAAGGQVVVEEDDIHQLFEPEVLRFNRFNRQRDTSWESSVSSYKDISTFRISNLARWR